MNAIKRYVNAVDRRLHLPLAVRARVMSDFATTIQSLREEGLDDEAIMKKLGEPRCAAARLRAELGEYAAPQKSPLRWLFLALAAALAALAYFEKASTPEYIEIYSDDDDENDAF